MSATDPTPVATDDLLTNPETLARLFHEKYEWLAAGFGYKTREDSAVPWEQVPGKNQMLMKATAAAVQDALATSLKNEHDRANAAERKEAFLNDQVDGWKERAEAATRKPCSHCGYVEGGIAPKPKALAAAEERANAYRDALIEMCTCKFPGDKCQAHIALGER